MRRPSPTGDIHRGSPTGQALGMFLESTESKRERGEGEGPSREKNTTE